MTRAMMPPPTDDPRFPALVSLLGRTGAKSLTIEFHDDHDGKDVPTVWVALAQYEQGWQVAADLDPVEAVFGLADKLIDGGQCTHCGKPSAVDHEPRGFRTGNDEEVYGAIENVLCWYRFDPELATYRRSCEGER